MRAKWPGEPVWVGNDQVEVALGAAHHVAKWPGKPVWVGNRFFANAQNDTLGVGMASTARSGLKPHFFHVGEQESRALIPIEQCTILFNGNPLVVVRLPYGQPGVVLRGICENLHISSAAQVERIKRIEVIADDLAYVRVQTGGGPQIMPTLILHAAPYWLAATDTCRMEKDDPWRLEILNSQRNAVDALYE